MLIQVNDTELNIEDRGSGKPLLLIHGFPLNLEMWQPQVENLANHYRVIAIDLRGHGYSPPTPGPYTMDLLSDDCADVLKSLGVREPVILCGLSMGGYISFAFFRRHPNLVSGMILAATRAGADADQVRANRDKAIADTIQYGTQPVLEGMLPILMSPKTYQQQPEVVQFVSEIIARTTGDGIISAMQGMKNRPDSSRILQQINVPTLIIHGADDQIISLTDSQAMQAGIPNSKLQIIQDAGHLPNLEQPGIFNSAVFSFMASI